MNALQHAWQCYKRGDPMVAEDMCTRILCNEPEHPQALLLMGLVLEAQGRTGMSYPFLWQAQRMAPADAGIMTQLGLWHQAHGDWREAEAQFRQALVLEANHPLALEALASLLFNRGDYEASVPLYRQAQAAQPDNAQLQLHLAKALHNSRRFDEAEPHYQQVLQQQPDNPACRWEYAMQLLITGRFTPGWEYYDARLLANDWIHSGLQMYPFGFPLWQGEDIAGKTILVHGEQGLGDEIMFAGLIPELVRKAGKVILACSPQLADLFTRAFPCEVAAHPRGHAAIQRWLRGEPPPFLKTIGHVDVHCPLGSLPRYLRPDAASFAGSKPYLRASAQKTAQWGEQLAMQPGWREARLRVGLMWSGNLATGLMGKNKSIPLPLFKTLTDIPDVAFVGLQDAEYGRQLAGHRELGIVDVNSQIKNFDDTAALIMNVDRVITVDTSVAHLAGALGKPAWVPLCHHADWRWQAEADTSPWYPSLQLVRQTTPGDWAPVLGLLRQCLQA